MAKVIMIQGTMSGVGKSLVAAGLCRIFAKDGYRVAPFKSQNMSLNSYITKEGLEMGRAQVMQAEAAGIEPLSCMNPILLKPSSDTGSQVIVNGEVIGNMTAREYFSYKKSLIPEIKKAFDKLSKISDIIVIEGAGSPAEINLKENDIVNMGLAKMLDSPVLLVGDIDRGGVFAQLVGTIELLEKNERDRICGLIINKFRGDKSLLETGINMLEERVAIPVTGELPYMDIMLEDEDSLTPRFENRQKGKIDLVVIRYPRISNFTDFNVFEQNADAKVRYVSNPEDLGEPDIIFLPGSKNTMEDLEWMRRTGMIAAVTERIEDTPIFGICGGFQMLGRKISDPFAMEGGGSVDGMGILPIDTVIQEDKCRRQIDTELKNVSGILSTLNGHRVVGYEIHMGSSREKLSSKEISNTIVSKNSIYGTYLHGIFDAEGIAPLVLKALANGRGEEIKTDRMLSYHEFKETQYNILEKTMRKNLDIDYIYEVVM